MFRDLQWLKDYRYRATEAKHLPGPVGQRDFDFAKLKDLDAVTRPGESVKECNNSSCDMFGARCRAEAHGESMVDVFPFVEAGEQDLHLDIAQQVSKEFDFSGVEKMFDISGLDGALSIALCKRIQTLYSTVFDRPTLEPLGTTGSFVKVHRPGVDSRVTFVQSSNHDMWLEILRGLHDAVFMSHAWSGDEHNTAATATMLMYKLAFEGVRPGGVLFVYDSSTDANPVVSEYIETSGFSVVQRISVDGASKAMVIVGRKP